MSINISDKLWRESIDKIVHNKYYQSFINYNILNLNDLL
jgi:hypothetical protein